MIARRVFLLAAAAALFAAQATAENTRQGKIKAVASFSILADLVRNVGGDRVEVETLVGPNGDVHVYSPTPGDAKTLAAADVVFVNGLGLEGWMTRLVAASSAKAPMVVVYQGYRAAPNGRRKSSPAAASRSIRMPGNPLPTPKSMSPTSATA